VRVNVARTVLFGAVAFGACGRVTSVGESADPGLDASPDVRMRGASEPTSDGATLDAATLTPACGELLEELPPFLAPERLCAPTSARVLAEHYVAAIELLGDWLYEIHMDEMPLCVRGCSGTFALNRISLCDGVSEAVVRTGVTDWLVAGGGRIFFLDASHAITRLEPETNEHARLVESSCVAGPTAVDSRAIYYVNACTSSIDRIAHGGTTSEPIACLDSIPGTIAAYDGLVYWLEGEIVHSVGHLGGSPRTVAEVDGMHVLGATNRAVYVADTSGLRRVSLDTGTHAPWDVPALRVWEAADYVYTWGAGGTWRNHGNPVGRALDDVAFASEVAVPVEARAFDVDAGTMAYEAAGVVVVMPAGAAVATASAGPIRAPDVVSPIDSSYTLRDVAVVDSTVLGVSSDQRILRFDLTGTLLASSPYEGTLGVPFVTLDELGNAYFFGPGRNTVSRMDSLAGFLWTVELPDYGSAVSLSRGAALLLSNPSGQIDDLFGTAVPRGGYAVVPVDPYGAVASIAPFESTPEGETLYYVVEASDGWWFAGITPTDDLRPPDSQLPVLRDVWVTKVDPRGQEIWRTTFRGPRRIQVIPAANDELYVLLTVAGTFDVGGGQEQVPTPGHLHTVLVKLDASGVPSWRLVTPGTGSGSRPFAREGLFYTATADRYFPASPGDGSATFTGPFLLHLDAEGALSWATEVDERTAWRGQADAYVQASRQAIQIWNR
jgi:hypothetical protein